MRKLLKHIFLSVMLTALLCCSDSGVGDSDVDGESRGIAFSVVRADASMTADSRAGAYVTNVLGLGVDVWSSPNFVMMDNQPIYCIDDESASQQYMAGSYDPPTVSYEAYVGTYLNAYVYYPYHDSAGSLTMHGVEYPYVRVGDNNAPEVLVDFGFDYHSEDGGYYSLPTIDGVGGADNPYYYGVAKNVKVERSSEQEVETVLNVDIGHMMSRMVINIVRDASVSEDIYFRVESCHIPSFRALGYFNLESGTMMATGDAGNVYVLRYSQTDYPYGRVVTDALSTFVDTQAPCLEPDIFGRLVLRIEYSISTIRGSGENGDILPSDVDGLNTDSIIEREEEVNFSGPDIIQFRRGYKYTYNIVLSADRITVAEAEIEPWKAEVEDVFGGTTEEDM